MSQNNLPDKLTQKHFDGIFKCKKLSINCSKWDLNLTTWYLILKMVTHPERDENPRNFLSQLEDNTMVSLLQKTVTHVTRSFQIQIKYQIQYPTRMSSVCHSVCPSNGGYFQRVDTWRSCYLFVTLRLSQIFVLHLVPLLLDLMIVHTKQHTNIAWDELLCTLVLTVFVTNQ